MGCQSLVYVEGELVGDPLELAAFNATGAMRFSPWPSRCLVSAH